MQAQFMKNDPQYLSCKHKGCSGSLKFHVVNIRSEIEFAFFTGGYLSPCLVARSIPIKFENPKMPLYGHLSSTDSTGTSMRLTWVSGDNKPQEIQYGDGKKVTSGVTTFSQRDMCSTADVPSPAKDFGWHDPGFIHSAVMTGLKPSSTFSYKYGSDSVGWSEQIQFSTPPAGGASEDLRFIAFGDMGKTPLDDSNEHYIQPGAHSVITAIADDVKSNNIKSIFHIGDISYATGFLAEWDYFLHLISPVASKISYMTAIGNHERDYISSGSVYGKADSGGECGVPYETYFPMPVPQNDKPWYSIEQASVHFTIISTEHDWSPSSEQYQWIQKDLASVNRKNTPWLVFMGHRQMYHSGGLANADLKFINAIEPVLLHNKVDLVLFGHVHNYERTCSVYQNACFALPQKDAKGVDTYNHRNYTAPVHAIIGMAGFTLDKFPNKVKTWSLKRISKYGYLRGHATRTELKLEFVNSDTRKVDDAFRITK
ncbi:hypothetical protein Lal_00019434 [Lupinus albus]|nr:hypothetical protein Lal_00019434 [Lupinus albus]